MSGKTNIGAGDAGAVGVSCPRIDGTAKVRGEALFAADWKLPGMLCCRVLRSTVPHALLRGIDVSAALAAPGVAAVYTAADIPGENRFGIIVKDEPVLVEDRIRKVGDALALVVGESEEAVAAALPLVKVDCQELPGVFSAMEAMADGAPAIHGQGNIQSVTRIKRGDVDNAFARAKVVITRRYTTQMAEHAYLEPEAGVAAVEDGCVRLWVSTQNPHYDRREVARVLGIGQHRVRVIQAATGGGFGGKLDISVQCLLALAALKTGRPVRLVYQREESMVASPKRHPYIIEYTSACDGEGRLLGVKVKIIGDTGAYASYGPATLKRSAVHAAGPYAVPNVSIEAYCVYTNNPTAGAMRGFGVPQAAFAHETQMDLLAEALGLDPFTIRLRNCLQPGSLTATGQRLSRSVGIGEAIERARSRAQELGMLDKPAKNRGVGVGCMWYGIGNTGAPNPAGAFLDFLEDGTVLVLSGCADIGQGSSTALAQIAAEELGVKIEDVHVLAGDTGVSPDAGATSASRQTYISGNAVRLAARQAKEALLREAGRALGAGAADLRFAGGHIWRAGEKTSVTIRDILARCRAKGILTLGSGWFNPETTGLDENGQGIPYATYSYAAQVAEVEVCAETGKVSVLRLVAAHDVGRAINPRAVEGQIEGGCLMGMGYALLEEVKLSKGKIENPRFAEYLLPMSLDTPEIYPVIVEAAEDTGPFGAKGVGEPALIPTAAAIASAAGNALGIKFYDLPITPEKIVAALTAREDKKEHTGVPNLAQRR
ncbi:MAG: xanthine dehydrogenase family protein molybdopterin-binding subunit [Bacillota bacterium]